MSARPTSTLGSKVEQICSKWAKERGWLCVKIAKTSVRGFPDRLFLRDSRYVWVEFKGATEVLLPAQERRIGDLAAQGATVWVCRDVETFKQRMI